VKHKINSDDVLFEVGQVITVNGKKAEVLGIVEYSNPVECSSPPEYAIEMDTKKCWLEPFEGTWRLWKNVSGEGNPVVEAIVNSDMTNAVGVTYGEDFCVSSHGIAITTESIGNTWEVEIGDEVELWRGENLVDKECPFFIAECNKNGVMLWFGQYVSVSVE